MTSTFNHGNYEITVIKKEDCVYIQFLDNQFYKLYSNSYLDTDIFEFKMSLDMFYTVIITVFNALIEDNKEHAVTDILPSSDNIKLKIHHKYYLQFIFELTLKINKDCVLGAKDICIKKLEQNINTLSTNFNKLSKDHISLNTNFNKLTDFVDKYMEMSIINNCNIVSYILKLNTPNIKIDYYDTVSHSQLTNRMSFINVSDNLTTISLYGNWSQKFNESFKMIKCHTLELNNTGTDFNYKNLPLSLDKLIISGSTPIIYFKDIDLPNLKTIELKAGSTITKIYSSISHIKSIKTIIINSLPNFEERDLLLTNGIKVVIT